MRQLSPPDPVTLWPLKLHHYSVCNVWHLALLRAWCNLRSSGQITTACAVVTQKKSTTTSNVDTTNIPLSTAVFFESGCQPNPHLVISSFTRFVVGSNAKPTTASNFKTWIRLRDGWLRDHHRDQWMSLLLKPLNSAINIKVSLVFNYPLSSPSPPPHSLACLL